MRFMREKKGWKMPSHEAFNSLFMRFILTTISPDSDLDHMLSILSS
jgi:hypothetical protein